MAAKNWFRNLCLAALGMLISGCAFQEVEPAIVIDEAVTTVAYPEVRRVVVSSEPASRVPDPSPPRSEGPGLIPMTREEAIALLDSGVSLTDEQTAAVMMLIEFATASIDTSEADFLENFEGDDLLPPLLPWPPPPASLAVTLKREPLLAQIGEPEPKIGIVGDFLAEALAEAGYDGRIRYIGLEADESGHRYPDEFALVTGMEQIDEDAQPLSGPARWAEEIQIEAKFSIGDFLRALFLAPTGHYRVLVFVVTHRQVQGVSDVEISAEMVGSFSEEGGTSLPLPLRENVFGPRHQVTALIYEFEKAADDVEATQKRPSLWRAVRHLAHTRLVAFMPGQ